MAAAPVNNKPDGSGELYLKTRTGFDLRAEGPTGNKPGRKAVIGIIEKMRAGGPALYVYAALQDSFISQPLLRANAWGYYPPAFRALESPGISASFETISGEPSSLGKRRGTVLDI
jgi:hypothetical protein